MGILWNFKIIGLISNLMLNWLFSIMVESHYEVSRLYFTAKSNMYLNFAQAFLNSEWQQWELEKRCRLIVTEKVTY